MGKKKNRKRREAAEHHASHHEHVQQIIEEMMENLEPSDRHVMPVGRGHLNLPWCYCVPEVTYEHPLTHARLWTHRHIVH